MAIYGIWRRLLVSFSEADNTTTEQQAIMGSDFLALNAKVVVAKRQEMLDAKAGRMKMLTRYRGIIQYK